LTPRMARIRAVKSTLTQPRFQGPSRDPTWHEQRVLRMNTKPGPPAGDDRIFGLCDAGSTTKTATCGRHGADRLRARSRLRPPGALVHGTDREHVRPDKAAVGQSRGDRPDDRFDVRMAHERDGAPAESRARHAAPRAPASMAAWTVGFGDGGG
jgi:hypothetical protein